MSSYLEWLQAQLKELEPEYPPDNPIVMSLKWRIIALTKPPAENPFKSYNVPSSGNYSRIGEAK